MQPANHRPPLTPASILVSLLILLAAATLIALFLIPNSSPWFWPTMGLLAAIAALALVIPLNPPVPK